MAIGPPTHITSPSNTLATILLTKIQKERIINAPTTNLLKASQVCDFFKEFVFLNFR
jgi:hypothetical protein